MAQSPGNGAEANAVNKCNRDISTTEYEIVEARSIPKELECSAWPMNTSSGEITVTIVCALCAKSEAASTTTTASALSARSPAVSTTASARARCVKKWAGSTTAIARAQCVRSEVRGARQEYPTGSTSVIGILRQLTERESVSQYIFQQTRFRQTSRFQTDRNRRLVVPHAEDVRLCSTSTLAS